MFKMLQGGEGRLVSKSQGNVYVHRVVCIWLQVVWKLKPTILFWFGLNWCRGQKSSKGEWLQREFCGSDKTEMWMDGDKFGNERVVIWYHREWSLVFLFFSPLLRDELFHEVIWGLRIYGRAASSGVEPEPKRKENESAKPHKRHTLIKRECRLMF